MAFTLADAAKAVGVTPQIVRTTIHQGRVPDLDEFASVEEFARHWDENIMSEAVEAAKRISVDGFTLNEMRLKSEIIKVKLLEHELEERTKQLIFADVARKLYSEVIQMIREGLMSLPARHAPILAAEYGVDAHKVFLDIEAIVRDFCSRLSDEIEFPERKPIGRPRKGT
jgi:hypothetical protein